VARNSLFAVHPEIIIFLE
jgi:serine-type D-Ala-D-Ala carboxypeptidase (penicillin-binding protein 5/6)